MSAANLETRVGILERRMFKVESTLGITNEPVTKAVENISAQEVATAESTPPVPDEKPETSDKNLQLLAAAQIIAPALHYPPALQRQAPRFHPATPPPLPPMMPQVEIPPQSASYRTGKQVADFANRVLSYHQQTLEDISPEIPQGKAGLEQALGLKWSGRIGAVVLVIGAALGIKYAYDQGWFGGIPDGFKVAMMLLAGMGLIGAGEYVLRKIHKLSAVGLFAAGIAMCFLGSYSGFGFYGLYERGTAFFLMIVCTLIGSAVSRRGNLVSIAVLSLIGGNLAPLILGGSNADLTSFLCYLMMLQLIGLILAGWGREAKWWTLRSFSLATTSLWFVTMLLDGSLANAYMSALIFLIASAVFYHAELIFTTLHANENEDPKINLSRVAFSGIVTSLFVVALLILNRGSTDITRGMFVLGTALVTLATAWLIPVKERPAMMGLRYSYRIQTIALMILAVPILLGGFNVEIAWLLQGLVFAIVGRKLDSRISRFAAIVVWLLAALHLNLTLSAHAVSNSHAFIRATLVTITGHLLAVIFESSQQYKEESSRLSALMHRFAAGVWIISSVITLHAALPITFAWTIYGICLMAAHRFTKRTELILAAFYLIGATAFFWLLVDLIGIRLDVNSWNASQYWVIINPIFGSGVILAGLLLLMHRYHRLEIQPAVLKQSGGALDAQSLSILLLGLPMVMLTMGLGFEIDRFFERMALFGSMRADSAYFAKQVTLSIYMAILAVALIGLGFKLRIARVRYAGLALFAATLAKVVLIDLAEAGQGYRVLSFLGTGILLLATSVIYGKLSPKLLR